MLYLFNNSLAVDRSLQSSISDARDAIVNVCVDVLSAYKSTMSSAPSGLYAPSNLRLLPLYLAALLKSVGKPNIVDRIYLSKHNFIFRLPSERDKAHV